MKRTPLTERVVDKDSLRAENANVLNSSSPEVTGVSGPNSLPIRHAATWPCQGGRKLCFKRGAHRNNSTSALTSTRPIWIDPRQRWS